MGLARLFAGQPCVTVLPRGATTLCLTCSIPLVPYYHKTDRSVPRSLPKHTFRKYHNERVLICLGLRHERLRTPRYECLRIISDAKVYNHPYLNINLPFIRAERVGVKITEAVH